MTLVRVSRWTAWALAIVLILLIGAQFLGADRTNPPSKSGASLLAQKSTPAAVSASLERAGRGVHENERLPPHQFAPRPPSSPRPPRMPRGRTLRNSPR